MQYEDLFAGLIETFDDAVIVSTCGHISRDLFNHSDRPGNFYLVGSMGMAGPVALGISLIHPTKTVIAIDGDGSVAMNLSGLASIATAGNRILHVVLDNGQHGSTGGQAVAEVNRIDRVAADLGYKTVMAIDDSSASIADQLATIDRFPAFAYVRVEPRASVVGERVRHTPHELRDRVTNYLATKPNQLGVTA